MAIRIDPETGFLKSEPAELPYNHKRGKILPSAKPAWGQKDALGRERDLAQEAEDCLNETLRN